MSAGLAQPADPTSAPPYWFVSFHTLSYQHKPQHILYLTWILNFYLNLLFYICKLKYLDIIYPSKNTCLKVAAIGGQNT